MELLTVDYQAFKAFVLARTLSPQMIETGTQYHLRAADEFFQLGLTLTKGTHADDVADFELNLKAIANRKLNISSGEGWRARFKGMAGTAAHGTATAVDMLMTEDRIITGTHIVLSGSQTQGDWAKMEIVHPTYGVVDLFGDTWFIPSTTNYIVVEPGYYARITAGLKIRVTYTSVGATDVWFAANLLLHKPLI